MINLHFESLVEPKPHIAEVFTRWENDPVLIPFSRPNPTREDLEKRAVVTLETLAQRLTVQSIYLIYLNQQLIGEMNYRVDPPYLFRQEAGTAWIGITIGEAQGRGKGIGYQALQFLEQEIRLHGCVRIELGVFAFNKPAIALYKKLNYQEIGRIADFTYWDGRLWQDIRMEKMLKAGVDGG